VSENETLVTEQVAENVETTTEEIQQPAAKTYTQEEVDAIVGKKIARTKARIEKDYDRKYGDLMDTLRAGTGKESIEEVKDTFQKFYASKGIKMPQKPSYSARDVETLGKADADEIIRNGYEDVVEEVERLTAIGADKMSAREKAAFKILAEHRQSAEKTNELKTLGIPEDVVNSKDFSDFAAKFNPGTPMKDVYDIYNRANPRKTFKTMGSMKNHETGDKGVKDFYTPEEARKFTKKDFDNNPALFKAVENSMLKWRK
jgi:hypothetical protein